MKIAQQRLGEAWWPCAGYGESNSCLLEALYRGGRTGSEVLVRIKQRAVNIGND